MSPWRNIGNDGIHWVFEPKVAKRVFKEMLAETKIRIINGHLVEAHRNVHVEGQRLYSILLANGKRMKAKIFIDSTHEGDLPFASGVKTAIGRKATKDTGEASAAARLWSRQEDVDPYRIIRNPESGLLSHVAPTGGETESDNGLLRAYCLRLTLTDAKENQVLFARASEPMAEFIVYPLRRVEANPEILLLKFLIFTPIPNRKMNTNGIEFVGLSRSYIKSEHEQRLKSMMSFTTI